MDVIVRSQDLVNLLDVTRHYEDSPLSLDGVRARLERAAHIPATAQATPEQMLREFHATKNVHQGVLPDQFTADVPDQVRDCRIELLAEEVEELREALMAGDIVGIADGVADVAFVVVGTAVRYGIPFDAVLREVFRSNMTKINPDPMSTKLVKGPEYEPPDIAGVLAEQWQLASDGRYWPLAYLQNGPEPEIEAGR